MPEAVANGTAAPATPAPPPDPATSTLKRERSPEHHARMQALTKRLDDESEREYAELREQKTLGAIEADGRGDKSAKAAAATEEPKPEDAAAGDKSPAAEASPAAEETPEQKREREQREKFDKTVRAEGKIVRREAEIARREREVEAGRRKLETDTAQHAAILDGARDFVQKLRDPASFLELAEQAGVSPERIAAWLRDSNDPQKAAATRAEQIASEKVRALEERFLESERRAAESERRVAETQFLAHCKAHEEELDAALITFSERELLDKANELATIAARKGLGWGFNEVAEALNELAEQDPRYQRIKTRLQPGAPSTEAAATTQATTGRQAAKSGPTATLTNEATSERATITAKGKLPRDQRLRLLFSRLDKERA